MGAAVVGVAGASFPALTVAVTTRGAGFGGAGGAGFGSGTGATKATDGAGLGSA